MAALKTIDQANSIVSQSVITTAETILVTSPLVAVEKDNGFAAINLYAALLGGTGATFVTLRLRRGTTVAGTVIGNPQPIVLTAGAQFEYNSTYIDTYALAGTLQYVFTAQFTAATGNSTVAECTILVLTF